MLVNDSTAVLPVVVVVIPRVWLPSVPEECEDCVDVAEDELESIPDVELLWSDVLDVRLLETEVVGEEVLCNGVLDVAVFESEALDVGLLETEVAGEEVLGKGVLGVAMFESEVLDVD